jgi:hypothetical protein
MLSLETAGDKSVIAGNVRSLYSQSKRKRWREPRESIKKEEEDDEEVRKVCGIMGSCFSRKPMRGA